MTESEWLSCSDPQPMLEFLHGRASDRKLRLFAYAHLRVRCGWQGEQSRTWAAVDLAERFLDGLISHEELDSAVTAAEAAEAQTRCAPPSAGANDMEKAIAYIDERQAHDEALETIRGDTADILSRTFPGDWYKRIGGVLLREVFGNPFRLVVIDPNCLTPDVVSLAHTIHQRPPYYELSEMAHVLQAAGCSNAELLDHCRNADVHFRGCWVLDLILRKE